MGRAMSNETWMCAVHSFCPFLVGLQNADIRRRFRWAEVFHSDCLRRIVGVKLTDRHALETTREQCGTSSLELMVRRRALQWMAHVF
eukprot:350708-Chlamydomonas_euryale.AAC.5